MAWYEVSKNSRPLNAGDVVCLAEGGAVTSATDAALEASGLALGVSLSAGAGGGAVRVAEVGAVPASITGLGVGAAGWAIVQEGRCARAAQPGSAYVIGRVLADGTLQVYPQPPPPKAADTPTVHVDSAPPPPHEPDADPSLETILVLIRAGKKIDAIKLYREIHQVGLKEAKDAVDRIAEEQP